MKKREKFLRCKSTLIFLFELGGGEKYDDEFCARTLRKVSQYFVLTLEFERVTSMY